MIKIPMRVRKQVEWAKLTPPETVLHLPTQPEVRSGEGTKCSHTKDIETMLNGWSIISMTTEETGTFEHPICVKG